jgi:GT2 family glycosyltransferase
MDISIVIPNYNGAKLLEKNLPKVLEAVSSYKEGKIETIIVDDASTDNSLDLVKDKDVVILKNEKNLGFSSTVNNGVRKATGDIVILLNTDVYPQKNFLEPLLKHFEDSNVFAVGCLDKSIEGEKVIERGRGLGEWKRGFLIHRRGEVDKTNTLWVTGGSGAFRKSIWDKLEGFNELYNPFYWEDIDLSYRALKSGYKIFFEPKSIVFHEHEKGSIKGKYTSSQIKTIAYRNQFIFVWENATDYSLQFAHFFWLPYHFIKALLRMDLAFFLGFLKAFVLLPKVIKSSLKYQKTFVKKDEGVVKNFI